MRIPQNVLGSILVSVGKSLKEDESGTLFIDTLFTDESRREALAAQVSADTGLELLTVNRALLWAENDVTALDDLMVESDSDDEDADDDDDDKECPDDDDDDDGFPGPLDGDLEPDPEDDDLTDEDETERALIRGERLASRDDF